MSAPGLPHWCKHLRWKSYPAEQQDPAQVAQTFHEGGVTYSCLKTLQPFGVDDRPCGPESCHQGRACYVAHPNLRLPVV